MAASEGGIVTRLTGKNARIWWIHGSQTKPGSRFGMQVICHNAAWVSTEATADTALGRIWIPWFAQSISVFHGVIY